MFSALAGLSPSCCAVLVQIEHWATKSAGAIKKSNNNTIKIKLPLAMAYEIELQKYNENR